MIRNSVTLYEDDAWEVVSALEGLIERIEQSKEENELVNDYKERLIKLKNKIENSL